MQEKNYGESLVKRHWKKFFIFIKICLAFGIPVMKYKQLHSDPNISMILSIPGDVRRGRRWRRERALVSAGRCHSKQHMNRWTVWQPCFADATFWVLLTSSGQTGLLNSSCPATFLWRHFKTKIYANRCRAFGEVKDHTRDEYQVTVYCKQLYLILHHDYQTVSHATKKNYETSHSIGHTHTHTHTYTHTHIHTHTHTHTHTHRDGEPSGYAENLEKWLFLWKQDTVAA